MHPGLGNTIAPNDKVGPVVVIFRFKFTTLLRLDPTRLSRGPSRGPNGGPTGSFAIKVGKSLIHLNTSSKAFLVETLHNRRNGYQYC